MLKFSTVAIIAAILSIQTLQADETNDIARQLSNPVASMISAPIQVNYQPNFGPTDDGTRWITNVQPVIPFALNDDWNLISRTIIPLVSIDSGVAGIDKVSGVGDILQSLFVSPDTPTANGWIWGAGPVFLIPTKSDVSTERWAMGPTAVALKQDGQFTYGTLFNHIWSVAGSDMTDAQGKVLNNINQSFIQPFFVYITPQALSYVVNSETTYDWERKQWTVPFNFFISQVLKVGGQVISVGAGLTYWAKTPENGPDGIGGRFTLTFIFPK